MDKGIRSRTAQGAMRILACVLGIVLSAATMPTALSSQEHFAIVVDQANSTSELTIGDLRRMFRGEIATWPDGRPVKLLLPGTDSRARDVVLRHIYGFREAELQRFLIRRTFQSAGAGPTLISDPELTKRLVREIPGAIAVVPLAQATGGVRIVSIDGRRPGQTGYPLTSPAARR